MDTRDREAIEGLFSKLGDVERQAGPRDAEAERFIADSLSRQPGAPYYMAQTIVMQDLALANQQKRIEELERGVQGAGEARPAAADEREPEGGMLSRILGSGGRPRSVPSVGASRPGSAWGGAAGQDRGMNAQGAPQQGGRGMGGGGFLAGAAQTAMGVAGGLLLGNALGNMFGGNEAQAADATPAAEPADTASDTADQGQEPDVQDASADDGGWFGGDDGGFDGGGFDDI
ncbi:DUF2076 domain-containing protein [Aureimonas glaciei]|uniref:DUF2076 domain-containing protein n=1 Tax=Aureimonas glaciei TaxID=1776957 RepID=A0A916XYP4_9HYPH|nr:DUF2076 family protein [Aureimonas glaciei]GGD21330.1 hypothetical protein GCM10011335_25320 [Aureimonas glaciei]